MITAGIFVNTTMNAQTVIIEKIRKNSDSIFSYDASYYFIGAWSMESGGLKTEEDFYTVLENKLDILDQKNQL
jgi:hypothetical protein